MQHRPRLDPAVAATRLAVRDAWAGRGAGTVLVGLSGGADSLALAAAAAFEAPHGGMRVEAVIVDHGLQPGSADVAARAARQARGLGLPARVERVTVGTGGGTEAAARSARYAALRRAADEARAVAVMVAHTLDDQAETVLLGLARGAGAASLHGMAAASDLDGMPLLRPFLHLRRTDTHAACAAQGLVPWHDPQNDDPAFARARVRATVLPMLEAQLGPGIALALARTADQLREDDDALARLVAETIEDIVEPAEAGIAVSVAALAANPPALRHRIIRRIVSDEFGQSLSRTQTVEVARLAVDWHGQGSVSLPGCRAVREGGRLVFTASAARP